MGIGNIFKIDDRYINIDRWSIIGDNCLLNVFTDYNQSNSLYFKSMIYKSKDMNKIVSTTNKAYKIFKNIFVVVTKSTIISGYREFYMSTKPVQNNILTHNKILRNIARL
jgi:hypothetical protein